MNPNVNKEKFHLQVSVSIQSLNRAGTWVTRPVLVTWLFGWKQVLAVNVLAGWRSTWFSLQGGFEGDCSGVGVLSLPSANDGGLVALSLVMCVSLGSSTEATAPTGGEVLLAERVISLWLLGLRCSLVLWYIFP